MIRFLRTHITPIFRRKRMNRMESITGIQSDWRIIDLGGSSQIWGFAKARPRIVFVNLDPDVAGDTDGGRLEYVTGDATALPYPDRSFDMVFSNSVIEHLHTWETQVKFAAEVRRLSDRYWVQTPARMSLIEPHIIGVIGHWLPRKVQPFFVRWFSVQGLMGRVTGEKARAFVAEVRMLGKREMRILFPDAEILTERFLLFPKSYIAVRKQAPPILPS